MFAEIKIIRQDKNIFIKDELSIIGVDRTRTIASSDFVDIANLNVFLILCVKIPICVKSACYICHIFVARQTPDMVNTVKKKQQSLATFFHREPMKESGYLYIFSSSWSEAGASCNDG